MRYFKKSEIILSEDTITEPKQIRFSADDSEIDLVLLEDSADVSKTYPTGTHSIDLDHLIDDTAKWLYVKADKAIIVTIDAQNLNLIANKPTEIWAEYSALTVTTTEDTRITIATAGK